MDDRQDQKYHQLTEAPIPGLLCKLALPSIIAMLVTSFYNMADTFFVGMLDNTSATGAVGVVFSMMAIIQATGFFFGQGSGNYISRALGRRQTELAGDMAALGFFSALIVGIAITLLGTIFLDPLVWLLGATETIKPYARSYLQIILIGAPYMIASMTLNAQLRFQGNAFYGMLGIASGAVINIGLDPLFIFGWGLGITGAALATIISQLIGFCLLVWASFHGGSLRLRISRFKPDRKMLFEIFRGGIPSLARQGLSSVSVMLINHAAWPYGDAAIAALSVVTRIMHFIGSSVIGFSQGFQPVCGFNYGAKKYARVKDAFWTSVAITSAFLTAMCVILILLAPSLISHFGSDADMIQCGAATMRFQCVVMPLFGFSNLSSTMLQTMGRAKSATALAIGRQGLFFIPLILILPHIIGITGIEVTQAASDLITFLVTVPIQKKVLDELSKPEEYNIVDVK